MNLNEKNNEMLNLLIQQHQNNYQNAIIEIIKNNTEVLFDEDIISSIKEPPLASMDLIKQKLLSLAKREQMVLNDDILTKLLSEYRNRLIDKIKEIKELRNDYILKKISNFKQESENDIIKLDPSDFNNINKKINKLLKESILENIDDILLKKFDTIYKNADDKVKKQKILDDFIKYMKSGYQKQILETISIKIMVKDRTLISGVAEQGERFLFTKSNSYIFKNQE